MNTKVFRDWLNDPDRATDYHPVMKCGHAANAVTQFGDPTCVICIGIDSGASIVASQPDLTGRMMRCYCTKPPISSNRNEAFFEYRGPGSRHATDMCKNCRYAYSGHLLASEGGVASHKDHTNCVAGRRDHCFNFEPRGAHEFDSYYCGCGGGD
jgi:hypothetical protein